MVRGDAAASDEALGALAGSVTWAALRVTLDESPEQIVVLTGPDLRLAYQNPASRRVLGPREPGRPAREAFPEWPNWVQTMEQVLVDGRTVTYEQAPITLHGDHRAEVLLLNAVATAIRDTAGDVVGVVSQAVDVTRSPQSQHGVRLALAAARVGAELSRSLDVEQVTAAVSRYAAEVFEGWCILDLYETDGSLARAALTHHDTALQELLTKLRDLPRVSGRALGRTENVSATTARTGQAAAGRFDVGALIAAASSEEHTEILRVLRPESYLSVPIRLGPRRLGALTVVRTEGEPPFTEAERVTVEQFAERAAIALAHARDYDEQRQAVLVLQSTLLPAPPRAVDGRAEVAVRYRAAGSGNEVGGDWYDVIALDGDRLAVVIGDVEGHDLPAAALMSQVRAVVHAFARSGLPPGRVVAEANAFLAEGGSDRLVTLAYFEVFPAERLLVWVRAGHVPAVVVDGDTGAAEVIEGAGGLPLGVAAGGQWTEETVFLPPRALLATFTDGLVERPDRPIDDGVAEVAALLGERRGDDIESLADRLLAGFASPRPPSDDVALVLVRMSERDLPGGDRVVRRLPAAAASAGVARHFVHDLLRSWAVGAELIETAMLLTSELVSNAARHTDAGMELRVERLPRAVRIGVFDDSHRLPHPMEPDLDASSGRGLQLVGLLSSDWGVETESNGKVVWFALPLDD